MDDLFAPPGVTWNRVSPRLATVRRGLLAVVGCIALLVLLLVDLAGLSPRGLLVLGAMLVVALVAWAWWLIGRNAECWGYAELEDELYITRGAFFRRLVVVPYGRMQYVDIQSGPLEQLNGIAKLRLHTASPGTSAVIPGLRAEEAARLRDRLTAMGETQAAGL